MKTRLRDIETEEEFLKRYDLSKYEHPSVTADVVAMSVQDYETGNYRSPTESKMSVLLIKRGAHPHKGMWALPGGFMKKGERVEQTAARELEEETGLKGQVLTEIGMFTTPGRDPRGWIISDAFLAIVAKSESAVRGGDDATEAKWFDIEEVLSGKLELAFDHLEVVMKAIEKLRPFDRDEYGFAFLPRTFTLAELQYVYEFMDGKSLIGPNFRRKMLPQLAQVEGEYRETDAAHRPASLFTRKA